MTTREFEEIAKKRGRKCPDGTVRFLMKLKMKGLINGGILPDGGWIWWI